MQMPLLQWVGARASPQKWECHYGLHKEAMPHTGAQTTRCRLEGLHVPLNEESLSGMSTGPCCSENSKMGCEVSSEQGRTAFRARMGVAGG